MRATAVLAIIGLVGVAQAAQAQERIRIGVNGVELVTTRTLSQDFSLTKNLEKAPIGADIDLPSSPLFDVGASVRLVKGLAVGIAYSSLSHTVGGTVDAQIPHPFYYSKLRDIGGNISGLNETEKAVHVAVFYFIPLGRLDLGVFGGPSRFDVKQDLITDVTYTELYPFDTATFASAPTTSVTRTAMGYNLGADVTWRLSRVVGVGGLIRFATASTKLEVAPGNEVTTDVGGLQTGVGLRLIF